MVGTVGNKGLKAHRYETGTSVPVSFFESDSLLLRSQRTVSPPYQLSNQTALISPHVIY